MITSYHTPVMLKESIEALRVELGKKYIDATVGGGGHAVEIIQRGGVLLGIDADREAIREAENYFKIKTLKLKIKGNWKLIHGNFRDIKRIAIENGFSEVDGILFDLGVSSHQIDTPGRGFSYRFTVAPLDLRFDQTKGITAREILVKEDEDALYEIFAKFGEEKHSRAIAHALVRTRQIKPVITTGDLLELVKVHTSDRKNCLETASRIFQALRIAVNDELNALREGITGSLPLLTSGGRLVIISFHSLEDRIVKQAFRVSGERVVTKKPVVPSQREISENIRARSAKMRIAQKI